MPRHSNYAEIVSQAEKAVASVNDPELKRAAFEKILEDLLDKGSDGAEIPTESRRSIRSIKRTAKASRKRAAGAKNRKGPQSYLGELVDDDFFRKPKTIAEVKAELGNRGHHIAMTSLSGPLQKLCQRRTLRRQRVKKGTKQTFIYSNW
jgi:hypothetical protein